MIVSQLFNATRLIYMKRLKIILIFLTLTAAAYGQQQTKLKRITAADFGKPGTGKNIYIYDNNLDKFVGTWVGNKDGKQVKVVLSKIAYKLSNDTANVTEMEIIKGTFQYTNNTVIIASYELAASTYNNDKNILSIFIDVMARKTQAHLLLSYLQNGTLNLEIGPDQFEAKNDKSFEFKGAMILTKQK
jgi:hypothetical protein